MFGEHRANFLLEEVHLLWRKRRGGAKMSGQGDRASRKYETANGIHGC
jgi:hypothetical protein